MDNRMVTTVKSLQPNNMTLVYIKAVHLCMAIQPAACGIASLYLKSKQHFLVMIPCHAPTASDWTHNKEGCCLPHQGRQLLLPELINALQQVDLCLSAAAIDV